MYVRLAFAVAAHLASEILVVDEVLAVGDAEFQKKCLGKMKDVAQSGRTVLFVSHNMSSIQTLCDKGVYLKAGRIMRYGPIDQVISEYLSTDLGANGPVWRRENLKKNPLSFTTVSLQLCGVQPRHKLEILAELESFSQHKPAFLACDIAGANGTVVLQALPALEGFIRSEPRTHRLKLTVDLPPLIPGLYNITMWVGSHNNQTLDLISRCAAFEITESPTAGRSYPHHAEHGYVVPDSEIRDETEADAAERPVPGMTQHVGKD
jgi:lipopolysaccharide transport system ATP-binding protein